MVTFVFLGFLGRSSDHLTDLQGTPKWDQQGHVKKKDLKKTAPGGEGHTFS